MEGKNLTSWNTIVERVPHQLSECCLIREHHSCHFYLRTVFHVIDERVKDNL